MHRHLPVFCCVGRGAAPPRGAGPVRGLTLCCWDYEDIVQWNWKNVCSHYWTAAVWQMLWFADRGIYGIISVYLFVCVFIRSFKSKICGQYLV